MMIGLKPATFAAVLAFAALPAAAATVDVTSQHASVFGDAAGQDKWFIKTSYTNGSETRKNVNAGAFRLNGTFADGSITPFMAFCLSPFEWLRLPVEYTVGPELSADVVKRLSALANGAWGQITDKITAGAFQLAAWEIVSEDASLPLNLDAGGFQVTWVNKAKAKTLAQDWLDDVQNKTFLPDPSQITILSASDTQDLLTADLPVSPVPVPAAFGMLALALTAMAGAAARRKS